MSDRVVRGRGYVEGECVDAKLVIVERLNIYGDLDPRTGILRTRGVSVSGVVIYANAVVGSTVAPYITYALRLRGLKPCAIVTREEPDTVAVAAAVLGDIALARAELGDVSEKCLVTLLVEPPQATVKVKC